MIAVIILNWNNAPDTLECLASVYTSDDPNFSVIVADNGSEDDSLALLQKAYPQARFLANGENLGFAEGNNRAIRLAMEEGAEFVFLLNNDATIDRDTLSILRKAAKEHPNAAVLGPTIFYYDYPKTIWFGNGVLEPTSANPLSLARFQGPGFCQEIQQSQILCGCAFFARTSHLKIAGLMDPRYFLNWEEIDWCFRLRKLGFDCLWVGPAKAWHKISRSFVGGRGPMWHYYWYRNRLLWMETHLTRSEWLLIARKTLWPDLKRFIRHSFDSKKGKNNRAALAGFRDYLFRRFGKGSRR